MEMKFQFTVRWITRDPVKIDAIRKRFDIPDYTTMNGWSPAEIKREDMSVFNECIKRGLFSIIPKKWCKNGGLYIFKSR